MLPEPGNLLLDAGAPTDQEQFQILLQAPGLRLERIVSYGQPTPPGQWYDQDDPEWVLLVCGNAELDFGQGRKVALEAGDHLLIPARTRHRVAICSDDALWLALHFKSE
jgi:cupin 2 domain-containing protein